MEVAILQPYDCLKRQNHHQRRPLISGPTKPRRNTNLNLSPSPSPNPNPNVTPNPRSNRRRRNSPPPQQPNKAQQTRPNSPPSLGQVRILKRGEPISLPSPPSPTPPAPASPPAKAGSTGRILPGPMIDGFYAGSAFVTSPAPSEVPLPAFFTRRNCGLVSGRDAHNQEIACELRRVLKLC